MGVPPSRVMKLVVLSFSIVLAPVCIWAQAQADAPQVPEIEQILAPLRALEAKAGEAVQTRTKKYLADLKTLETNVAKATGELEQVLVVRKEREAWEKGEPTPAIDPKDESKPLELRKVRYYFDRERGQLETQAETALGKARQAAAAKLKRLEDGWTREKKIELAVAARNARLGLANASPQSENQAQPPGESVAGTPKLLLGEQVPFVNKETGSLRAWGKTSSGVEIEKTLPNSGQFVQVAAGGADRWFALARNGTCLVHSEFGKSIDNLKEEELKNIVGFSRSSQTYPTNKDGDLWIARSNWKRDIRLHVSAGLYWYSFANNGKISIGGTGYNKNPDKKPPLEKLENVVLGGGTPHGGFGAVFFRADGSAFGWAGGRELAVETGGERIVALDGGASAIAGISESGKIFFWSASGSPAKLFTDGIPHSEGPFTNVRLGKDVAAARKQDGSWVAWAAGGEPNVIAKINSLGRVKDMDFQESGGWVIWIE